MQATISETHGASSDGNSNAIAMVAYGDTCGDSMALAHFYEAVAYTSRFRYSKTDRNSAPQAH